MAKAIRMNIASEGINKPFFPYTHPSSLPDRENEFVDFYGKRIDVPVPETGKAIRGFSDDPAYTFGQDPNIPMSNRAIQTEDITRMPGYIPREEIEKPSNMPIETLSLLSPAEAEKIITKQAGERPTIPSAMNELWPTFKQHAVDYYVSQGHYPDVRELGEIKKEFDKDPRMHEQAKMKIQSYDQNIIQQKTLVEETRLRKKTDAAQYKETISEGKKKIDLLGVEERKTHMLRFQKETYEIMKDPDPESRAQKIAFAIAGLPEVEKEDKVTGVITEATIKKSIDELAQFDMKVSTKLYTDYLRYRKQFEDQGMRIDEAREQALSRVQQESQRVTSIGEKSYEYLWK